jgi:hypothetical protein
MRTPEVKVGQIWKDNDRRVKQESGYDRFLRIDRVNGDRAECSHVTTAPDGSWHAWYRRGRRSFVEVKLSRFRPTSSGYLLVRDAPSDIPLQDPEHSHQKSEILP